MQWGKHLFDFKESYKYQKLITETGLAKTDFPRSSTASTSTHSLQMVLEAKWVRGSDGSDSDYPHIYKPLGLVDRPTGSQRKTRDILH